MVPSPSRRIRTKLRPEHTHKHRPSSASSLSLSRPRQGLPRRRNRQQIGRRRDPRGTGGVRSRWVHWDPLPTARRRGSSYSLEQDIPQSNENVPKETIEEVASTSQEQIQESNDNEPMDVIEEEVVLEHQEQDVQEHNEDELEDIIEGIAPKYQGYCYFLAFCFPISRKGTQQQVRATVHHAQLEKFLWSELQVATDNFSKSNILGRGVFGRVYKGRLLDGSLVAVKRQKERSPVCDLQFQTEIAMINMEVHRNLLRLRGFCKTPTERLLVYPWMSNGSVASWLYERQPSEPPLDWNTRRRIAIGSARGLSCLHDNCDPKIIHRDVKPANIFLDENFEAVLGDFGHAKLMDYIGTHETTTVCGTFGHIAPEYDSSGRCSEKADVFSYGITLLELITGKRAYDPEHALLLLDWVTSSLKQKKVAENFGMFVDPDLSLNYNGDEVESLIQVALLCTDDSPLNRPGMSEVLRLIEDDGLAERWNDWQTGTEQQTVGSTNNHLEQIPDAMVHSDKHFEQIRDTFIYADNNHLRDVELSGPR